ncbi:Ltp family lipoprotein [Pontivivens nitratireducens]|uniref:Ltp family lipoprotein n=1 Tax=Pontivivens nitratireducens TaxID=2758038 RepID=UPI00163B0A92|nr:Ltp family lipoprotein [Pontibrevibacter nitratireducens]
MNKNISILCFFVSAFMASAALPQTLNNQQKNAVRLAESYLSFSAFSRQGLIDQLSSEFGEQFDITDATVAVDSLFVNWNEQASRSADEYLKMMGFSCQGLIDQLSSAHGEQFTVPQATYGAQQAGAC